MHEPRAESLSSAVVVAVHDDLTAALIEASLCAAGFQVIRGKHGAHVEQLVNKHRARVVVLDLHTTRRTAVEVIRRLRRHDNKRFVRVLALSMQTRADVEEEARAAGADDFLSRPFLPADLVARVGRLNSVVAAA